MCVCDSVSGVSVCESYQSKIKKMKNSDVNDDWRSTKETKINKKILKIIKNNNNNRQQQQQPVMMVKS